MLFGFMLIFRERRAGYPRVRPSSSSLDWFASCSAQGEVLSLGHDTEKTVPATKPAKIQNRDQQMGSALRSVYQKTVDEVVPDDLLDLLGKLD